MSLNALSVSTKKSATLSIRANHKQSASSAYYYSYKPPIKLRPPLPNPTLQTLQTLRDCLNLMKIFVSILF